MEKQPFVIGPCLPITVIRPAEYFPYAVVFFLSAGRVGSGGEALLKRRVVGPVLRAVPGRRSLEFLGFVVGVKKPEVVTGRVLLGGEQLPFLLFPRPGGRFLHRP